VQPCSLVCCRVFYWSKKFDNNFVFDFFQTETDGTAKSNPGEAIPQPPGQQQQQQQVSAASGTSSTPTPPRESAARQNDDYDTDATESELALSEPPASPSPPVHDELSEHRAAGE